MTEPGLEPGPNTSCTPAVWMLPWMGIGSGQFENETREFGRDSRRDQE